MVGEESGGRMRSDGFVVAIDPIDGTWAFLSQTETYSTTLNVFRDGEPYLGIVSNPATGEVGYALAGEGTRLVRLDLFGEGDAGMDLPVADFADGKLLVNLHPGQASGGVQRALHEQWAGGPVRMVRSPGGSPAWALLDAARGHYTYANVWSRRPAEPWDLAAGFLLMRGAGGDVVDLEGRSIDPVAHSGPFVAGVDERGRDTVVEIVREALGE
jgi:fructose-1,6-bisphosphatase/inositol monophosphatase family enzyme